MVEAGAAVDVTDRAKGSSALDLASQEGAADVVALTDGYVATMLYSEIELLGDAYPELMRKFNLQLAKAALEDKLADTGMTLSDLGDSQLQEQLHALFKKQQRGQWKAQHKALQELREGLYREVYEELGVMKVKNEEIGLKAEDEELAGLKVENEEIGLKVKDEELDLKSEDEELAGLKVKNEELGLKVENEELDRGEM